MAEIVKVYRQAIPAVKFIGNKFGDEDRVNGSFAACWEQWLEQKWPDIINEAAGGVEETSALYEDGDACLGFMRYKQGEPFQYWIGKFAPLDTIPPEGLEGLEVPPSEIGACWVKGKEPDVYGVEMQCAEKLHEQGMQIMQDEQGAFWFFERYSSPRFFEPDENGDIIVDICHYVRPEENK